jgi:hypothetical protein
MHGLDYESLNDELTVTMTGCGGAGPGSGGGLMQVNSGRLILYPVRRVLRAPSVVGFRNA